MYITDGQTSMLAHQLYNAAILPSHQGFLNILCVNTVVIAADRQELRGDPEWRVMM